MNLSTVGQVHHGSDGHSAIDGIAAVLDGNASSCGVFHSGGFCVIPAYSGKLTGCRGGMEQSEQSPVDSASSAAFARNSPALVLAAPVVQDPLQELISLVAHEARDRTRSTGVMVLRGPDHRIDQHRRQLDALPRQGIQDASPAFSGPDERRGLASSREIPAD